MSRSPFFAHFHDKNLAIRPCNPGISALQVMAAIASGLTILGLIGLILILLIYAVRMQAEVVAAMPDPVTLLGIPAQARTAIVMIRGACFMGGWCA